MNRKLLVSFRWQPMSNALRRKILLDSQLPWGFCFDLWHGTSCTFLTKLTLRLMCIRIGDPTQTPRRRKTDPDPLLWVGSPITPMTVELALFRPRSPLSGLHSLGPGTVGVMLHTRSRAAALQRWRASPAAGRGNAPALVRQGSEDLIGHDDLLSEAVQD